MAVETKRIGVGSGAIWVEPYDPEWPGLFKRLSDNIASLLAGLSPVIHHVGSTSVPSLCAKPKIDIDIELGDAGRLSAAIERMMEPHRAFHGNPYGDGLWTFTEGHGSYGSRIYLCTVGNPEHAKRILFRDHLRSHPQAAASYAALKQRLAVEAKGDWRRYTDGKAAFVAEIVRSAARGKDLQAPV
jgi:GrpB-like predicted nucleotidyltransferase (UPF0157 family)